MKDRRPSLSGPQQIGICDQRHGPLSAGARLRISGMACGVVEGFGERQHTRAACRRSASDRRPPQLATAPCSPLGRVRSQSESFLLLSHSAARPWSTTDCESVMPQTAAGKLWTWPGRCSQPSSRRASLATSPLLQSSSRMAMSADGTAGATGSVGDCAGVEAWLELT